MGGLAFDEGGQLWAASANNDAIVQFAPGAHGNVTPSRVVAGPDTALLDPAGIAFDSTGRIYVANGPSQAITIYPPDASGNTPPQRTISGTDTALSAPAGITIDRSGHIWVANLGNSTLTEYPANANGDAAPLATIGGPTTQLNTPQGLGQDGSGNLLVGNSFGRSILRFANAAPFGDIAPKSTIAGPQSQLNTPQGVDADAARRTYVADSETGLLVFAAGASVPATVLTGPAMDIKAAGTVAVAPPFEVTTGPCRGRRWGPATRGGCRRFWARRPCTGVACAVAYLAGSGCHAVDTSPVPRARPDATDSPSVSPRASADARPRRPP